MDRKHLVYLLASFALLISTECRAQESLVTYKSLAPGIALELAQSALANCQQRGYQVAIAVVDRFGVTQVVLRDRFAGPHTPATATGKAWTAATFRNSTSNLFSISQPGMMQAGIRNLLVWSSLAGDWWWSQEGRWLARSAYREPPAAMPTRPAPRRA
jgi:uncharacterized protein GlcG (DUF336 family)